MRCTPSAERAGASISRFNENVKKGIKGKKAGFPKFQNNCRSVEYKTNSWKLSEDRKSISFTDKCGIWRVKMKGTRELGFYAPSQIKRVRLVKRADGFYIQFCVSVYRVETVVMTGKTVGLDGCLAERFGSDKYVVIRYSLAQNIVVMMNKIPNSTNMVF